MKISKNSDTLYFPFTPEGYRQLCFDVRHDTEAFNSVKLEILRVLF